MCRSLDSDDLDESDESRSRRCNSTSHCFEIDEADAAIRLATASRSRQRSRRCNSTSHCFEIQAHPQYAARLCSQIWLLNARTVLQQFLCAESLQSVMQTQVTVDDNCIGGLQTETPLPCTMYRPGLVPPTISPADPCDRYREDPAPSEDWASITVGPDSLCRMGMQLPDTYFYFL